MTTGRHVTSVLAAVLISGCVPVVSLHGLYHPSDLVFEEGLLGTWAEDVNDPGAAWQFSRLTEPDGVMLEDELKDVADKVYQLTLTDEKANKGVFVACLLRLDQGLFLDLAPAQFPAGGLDVEEMPLMYNAFFFVRGHTFLKVESLGPELRLCLTDSDIEKLLEADPNAVTHEVVDDRPVLTASTDRLQAFVRKYKEDDRLFGDATVLHRVARQADPNEG